MGGFLFAKRTPLREANYNGVCYPRLPRTPGVYIHDVDPLFL